MSQTIQKYKTVKVFNYHDIPEHSKEHYKLNYGCSLYIKVNKNSVYSEVQILSEWLIQNGAINNEEVFIFKY